MDELNRDLLSRKPQYRVKVAIVDSGIDATHKALRNRVIKAARYSVRHGLAIARPMPVFENNDRSGHGTAAAGIVATLAENTDLIDFGVLAADGRGYGFSVTRAVGDALKIGVDIINLSLSVDASRCGRRMRELLSSATQAGTVVVASYDNGVENNQVFPACEPNVIGVRSSRTRGITQGRAGGADYAAHGSNIVVALPGGGYSRKSGDSLAAAIVTALCARIIGMRHGLSTVDVRKVIDECIMGSCLDRWVGLLDTAPAKADDTGRLVRYVCRRCGYEMDVDDVFTRVRCDGCGQVGNRKTLLDPRLYFGIRHDLRAVGLWRHWKRTQRRVERTYAAARSSPIAPSELRCNLAASLLCEYPTALETVGFLRSCGYIQRETAKIAARLSDMREVG